MLPDDARLGGCGVWAQRGRTEGAAATADVMRLRALRRPRVSRCSQLGAPRNMKSVATGKISVLGRSSFVLHKAYNNAVRARESATARATLCVALFLLIFVGGRCATVRSRVSTCGRVWSRFWLVTELPTAPLRSVLYLMHTKGQRPEGVMLRSFARQQRTEEAAVQPRSTVPGAAVAELFAGSVAEGGHGAVKRDPGAQPHGLFAAGGGDAG